MWQEPDPEVQVVGGYPSAQPEARVGRDSIQYPTGRKRAERLSLSTQEEGRVIHLFHALGLVGGAGAWAWASWYWQEILAEN